MIICSLEELSNIGTLTTRNLDRKGVQMIVVGDKGNASAKINDSRG